MLLGSGVDRLNRATVAVFGMGGVGGYAVEALARAGVGKLILVDNDTVSLTNINRQIIALNSTVGQLKTEAMIRRVLDINPDARLVAYPLFYCADTAEQIMLDGCDYIIDAIDTVSSKLLLIERAKAAGVPVISCMGTGNKLDATRLRVSDIYQTSVCPLARVMRLELKKRGIDALRVVWSDEPPLTPVFGNADATRGRRTPGSVSFVPPAAGLLLASEAIKHIVGCE